MRKPKPFNATAVAKAIGGLTKYRHQCHAASLAIVRTGLLGPVARVARGWHPSIRGQHSWVIVGDPYDDSALILDATLWSYVEGRPAIQSGTMATLPHRPHGYGYLFDAGGPPPPPEGPVITLKGFSKEAEGFLDMIAPDGLDARGWNALCKLPVKGWPSKEIITKVAKDKRLSALVSIDIVGMVTDLNPGKYYW